MPGVGFTKNEKVSTTHHSLRILRTHTAISIHLLRLFSTDFFTETRRLRRTAANCGLEPYGIRSVLYCMYVPGGCTSTYLYILRIILRFPDLNLKSDDEWWWWWLMTRCISRFLGCLLCSLYNVVLRPRAGDMGGEYGWHRVILWGTNVITMHFLLRFSLVALVTVCEETFLIGQY